MEWSAVAPHHRGAVGRRGGSMTYKAALILVELGSTRVLVDLALFCGNLAVPPASVKGGSFSKGGFKPYFIQTVLDGVLDGVMRQNGARPQ